MGSRISFEEAQERLIDVTGVDVQLIEFEKASSPFTISYENVLYRFAALKTVTSFISHAKWAVNAIDRFECRKAHIESVKPKTFKILSCESANTGYGKVEYITLECGHKGSSNWHNLLKDFGCRTCAGKNKKTTEEFENKLFIVHGDRVKLISEYNLSTEPVILYCNDCGNCYSTTPNSILSNNAGSASCPHCRRIRLSLDQKEFKERVEKLTRGLISPIGEYKGKRKPVQLRCNVCDSEFKEVASVAYGMKGCHKCSAENNIMNKKSGWSFSRYIEASERRNHLTRLYIIRCYNECEAFYKVGISFEGVKKRFGIGGENELIPYKYKKVFELLIPAEKALTLEREVLRHIYVNGAKYIPEMKFHGRQECFKVDHLGEVCDFIGAKELID